MVNLGCKITSDGKSTLTTDINYRITQVKQVFFKNQKLIIPNAININIRKTLIKTTLVWSCIMNDNVSEQKKNRDF